MKITAIICARNELPMLRHVIPYLHREHIEVALVDNDSTDGTLAAAQRGEFPNLVHVESFGYEGSFDLSRQLEVKEEIARSLNSDWFIHQDADEILHGPTGWGALRHHIERAHYLGFNVVNFNELVMLPADPQREDVLQNNTNFYFFEPRPLRLMRAWRRTAGLTCAGTGGHTLEGGDVYVYPERMILKHFMVRSQKHAYEKYLGRVFSPIDEQKGWHANRRDFTLENLRIPTRGEHLHRLPTPIDVPGRLPRPTSKHFWEWDL